MKPPNQVMDGALRQLAESVGNARVSMQEFADAMNRMGALTDESAEPPIVASDWPEYVRLSRQREEQRAKRHERAVLVEPKLSRAME